MKIGICPDRSFQGVDRPLLANMSEFTITSSAEVDTFMLTTLVSLFVIYDFLGLKLGIVGSRDKPEIAPSTQFTVVDFCSMVPDMTKSLGSGYLSAVLPWQRMKDFEYYCRDNMNGEDCHGVP
ncbi:MAG: hypothetical protein ACOYYS_22125 [Chloroflexota bacterium]